MHLALVQALYRARGSPECAQILFDGPIRNCSRRSTLWARLRRYAFCTDSGITFLGSPFPYLPFHMHFPLVETLYRARGSPECARICFDCPLRNCSRRSSFRARSRWYAFCTVPGFTFSGFPSLMFLFICILHWCKHCTVLEVTTNVRKCPMTAQCEIAADVVVYGPFLVGTLFAPT